MLTEEYVFAALEAERSGILFPIDFDDVVETFGYSRKDKARQYVVLRSGLKRFTGKDSPHLGLSYQMTGNGKIVLSVDSYKYALARANTEKGQEYLLYLIDVEKRYRLDLERQLLGELDPEKAAMAARIAELEQLLEELKLEKETAIANHLVFNFPLDRLHQVSGIVNKSQVKNAVERDFVEGRDYVLVENQIFLNESTFNILVLSFRSIRGTDISQLPETIKITTRVYFQYQEMKRKNRRTAQQEDPRQMTLFGDNAGFKTETSAL